MVNTVVLALVAALFYASLRELRLPRYVVLGVPLIYGFLPHYATDRFWFAAHQASFSQAFFFLGIYTALRALRCGRSAARWLNVASAASFIFALLFYEVIVGLLPLVFLLIAYGTYRKHLSSGDAKLTSLRAASAFVLANAVCTGLTLAYKVRLTDRVVSPVQHPPALKMGAFLWKTLDLTLRFNVLHYGIGLPRVTLQLWRFSRPDVLSIITAMTISISIALYLRAVSPKLHFALLNRTALLYLIAAGFLIFLVDYAPFSILKSSFSYDGDNNRVAIAAAMGAALIMAGGTILLIRAVVPVRLQPIVLCGTIAVICGLNVVCIACFANCWSEAYTKQKGIISSVRGGLNLPPGSTVLLDGFCRYVGPAPVLQNSHDATGVLRIAYNDDSLQADVVSPELEVSDQSIRTEAFGLEQHYAYGGGLWLYNVKRNTILSVANSDAIRRYFQTINPDKNSGCPAGWEGMGSPIR